MGSWVDLDVKRLEPWFQLSVKHGTIAENSILLQYPFDFLPFVPISALRRRSVIISAILPTLTDILAKDSGVFSMPD
jgi:hypothetical protein